MSELANPLELGGYAVSFTTGTIQWLKQLPFFKNEWSRLVAPFLAMAFLLAWYALAIVGAIWIVQMLAVAFGTSVTGEGLYNVQKPLGFLSKGPDSPADLARAQGPTQWPPALTK